MELGVVSMEGAALAQSCFSPETTDQKILRLGFNSSRHWYITNLLYELFSCARLHLNFKMKKFKTSVSIVSDHTSYYRLSNILCIPLCSFVHHVICWQRWKIVRYDEKWEKKLLLDEKTFVCHNWQSMVNKHL